MAATVKLSDYVARFFFERGVRHAFAVTGGASLHLIHSVADTMGMSFVCLQHEQGCAMAADGYARSSGGLGVAIATSGPGATNLLTGVCGAYYDSVPVVFLTGQVSTTRMRGDTGVRQIGFQETATAEMFRPVTKYVAELLDPMQVRYELEKACHYALTGRPGPVLIDIPDNIQREKVDVDKPRGFTPEFPIPHTTDFSAAIEEMFSLLERSERPVVILGWGIHLAQAEAEARAFVQALSLPVAPTWAAADVLPSSDPLFVGTFGTHGTRYANFAVQNADLVISIGSRLDTKATGSPITTFARAARKLVVDIDPAELGKFERFGLNIDLLIKGDAKEFLTQANRVVPRNRKPNTAPWLSRIQQWKEAYPICPPAYSQEKDVNPYVLFKELANQSRPDDILLTDTGCSVAWMMQAFDFKAGQRLFHDFNNTAMGWALPASIGACFASGGKPVTCVTGDGSLQMNIQELATVIRHQLPIRIFLINNHGYSMIQQTQDQWMGSKYFASTVEGGLAFPDFVKVAQAYGFETITIRENREIPTRIAEVLRAKKPVFCNVEIDPARRVIPQVKFGRPNEDTEPLLERQEFLRNMIVQPLPVSQGK